jgi:hypothetical protein
MMILRMKSSSVVKVMAFLLPCAWLLLLAWVTGILRLRANYITLWTEHNEIMSGHIDYISSGNRLLEAYGYLSDARAEYLEMLELFLVLGFFPAFLIYFGLCIRLWVHKS